MTNQEAIDIIKTAIAQVEWDCPMDYAAAFDMAVKALERQDIPETSVGEWISVKDGMPENADRPGALCPRYLVMTEYGETEGWYNPDKGCWYTLVWFLTGRYTEDDIDMEWGDIPKISNKIEVTHWMPFP